MAYFVYILECGDKTLYTGITKDLKKRVHAHNNLRTGAKYTSTRRPVELKYSEKQKTIKKAMQREIEIKRWPRKKKLSLIKL